MVPGGSRAGERQRGAVGAVCCLCGPQEGDAAPGKARAEPEETHWIKSASFYPELGKSQPRDTCLGTALPPPVLPGVPAALGDLTLLGYPQAGTDRAMAV